MFSQTTSPATPRTSKVLVSGDIMNIDQTNVTLNIDDTNPFGGSEPNVPNTENVEEKLKQTEEEKRLIEVEKKKKPSNNYLGKIEKLRKMKKREKMQKRRKRKLRTKRKRDEREKKEETKKWREDETKPSSSSTLLSLASLDTNDDDQTYLMSFLAKLMQKNRTVKILQKTLMEVTKKMHSTLGVEHTE